MTTKKARFDNATTREAEIARACRRLARGQSLKAAGVSALPIAGVDLYINGKFVRTLRSDDEQIVSDITKYFVPGKNSVLLQARKVLGQKDQPKSTRADHFFRVIIGEGTMTADQVTIETPLIKFERTASDSNDVRQEFSVTTR